MIVHLYDQTQAKKELQRIFEVVNNKLTAGHRLIIEVKQETRSLAENAMLHSLLTKISQKIEWAGKKRDVDTWKRLLTAAWGRAKGENLEILPAIDGHGVDIVFRHTSKLTRSECAELIEYVLCWASQNGVDV